MENICKICNKRITMIDSTFKKTGVCLECRDNKLRRASVNDPRYKGAAASMGQGNGRKKQLYETKQKPEDYDSSPDRWLFGRDDDNTMPEDEDGPAYGSMTYPGFWEDKA